MMSFLMAWEIGREKKIANGRVNRVKGREGRVGEGWFLFGAAGGVETGDGCDTAQCHNG